MRNEKHVVAVAAYPPAISPIVNDKHTSGMYPVPGTDTFVYGAFPERVSREMYKPRDNMPQDAAVHHRGKAAHGGYKEPTQTYAPSLGSDRNGYTIGNVTYRGDIYANGRRG